MGHKCKISVIWSSPNTDGLTASAKNAFVSGIGRHGTEVEEVHLNTRNIAHCRACGNGWGTCLSKGDCVLEDDFAAIYRSLRHADGIVLVTAVYWHDVTECMKAFLDRLRRCETAHNGSLAGKKCFLVACAGGSGLGAIECLHAMEETIKHMHMQACDRIPVVRFNRDYMLPALESAGTCFAGYLETEFDA